jgi:hypothetical protein
MGIVATLVVVTLGLFVPAIVMVALPPRAIYLVIKAHPLAKTVGGLALIAWAYFVWQVLAHGFTSPNGPTVNPFYWFLIGCAWLFAEIVHGAAGRRR